MIVDADVHISPVATGGNSIFIEELIERMDYSQVDKALTWLQPPYHREIAASNEYVYRATQKYPQRILGFGWADPNLGIAHAKDMVKRSIYDYGFYGVKLNGAQNEFYIDDAKVFPVIEEIAKTGKIMAFHIGGDSPENTHPFRLAKIAKAFPETPILMVHMGGAHFHDFGNAAIEFAEQCPNITIIGSVIRCQPLLKAVKVLGAERVCFGSDTPFELMHVEVAKYKSLFENQVSQREYDLIMGGNIARLFKLDVPVAESI
jgi:uncharacterized protein